MGRWKAPLSLFLITTTTKSPNKSLFNTNNNPLHNFPNFPYTIEHSFFKFRSFSALPFVSPNYTDDLEYMNNNIGNIFGKDCIFMPLENEECSRKIPVKAYFLCTSMNLKAIQAEYLHYLVTPSSRLSNHIALRFVPSEMNSFDFGENESRYQYMVVFQYGSAVLFNVEDHEVEDFLQLVRSHASGLLPDMKKDDYVVKENPLLEEDMQGGSDYIVLKKFDTDSLRVIGSVLGQSIALDYFVSQVDGMVEEFSHINRVMEKTGNFTMDRKKLFKLVGKANSNLADVILKVRIFERSEIAWRDSKYAQILEYLREEYEVSQRFGNLNFKLKFVEHNIHFLQEVLQNRKSDLLEWCIIVLLSIENVISLYEIISESGAIPI
ncbi:hypothetical protein LIER_29568 [Lithospermum erythrorhizon]|uniref:DUF155 domain-containing protein n=1 Tax=Lithospermum erythrorhizon TaxID=34254 RepID=A0AAV3RLI0_LITER